MYESVHIERLVFELPAQRVTSQAIEDELGGTYKRLGIPAGCIETLVGIRARKWWPDGAQIGDLASDVAAQCLADYDVSRVGLVLSTSVSKDYAEPSVA